MGRTATATLSTANLCHNLSIIREWVGNVKIIGMVKANAYGHGLRSVSQRLVGYVDVLGVASIDEALALRKCGVNLPIMLSEGVFEPSELKVASIEKFQVVFHNVEQISWLKTSHVPRPLFAWLKVDTGMGRLGLPYDNMHTYYQELQESPNVAKPVRIMSHLACSGDKNHPLNSLQLGRFKKLVQGKQGEFSICNSAAIINFKESYYHYVRPGLMMYGVSPIPGTIAADFGLKPVMSLQSTIIAIKMIAQGQTVGYRATHQCLRDTLVAIIAFGYGDGYPITASSGAIVLVGGKECPIIGTISMDMLAVDISECVAAKVGDSVVLWGEQLPLEKVVPHTGQISWSMLTAVQHRVRFSWV